MLPIDSPKLANKYKKSVGICTRYSSHTLRLWHLPYSSKRATSKPHASTYTKSSRMMIGTAQRRTSTVAMFLTNIETARFQSVKTLRKVNAIYVVCTCIIHARLCKSR